GRASREFRARKHLRTRGVEDPARRAIDELDDHTGEVCRRRRRDHLVSGDRQALPGAEAVDELTHEARPRRRPSVHPGHAAHEVVRTLSSDRLHRDLLPAVLVYRRDEVVLGIGSCASVEDVFAREHDEERVRGGVREVSHGVDVYHARRDGLPGRSLPLLSLLLFVASAAFTVWRNTQVAVLVDISYILNIATRIAAGDVPYAQFPLAQAPLTFLTQAVLIKVFGPHFFV